MACFIIGILGCSSPEFDYWRKEGGQGAQALVNKEHATFVFPTVPLDSLGCVSPWAPDSTPFEWTVFVPVGRRSFRDNFRGPPFREGRAISIHVGFTTTAPITATQLATTLAKSKPGLMDDRGYLMHTGAEATTFASLQSPGPGNFEHLPGMQIQAEYRDDHVILRLEGRKDVERVFRDRPRWIMLHTCSKLGFASNSVAKVDYAR